MSSTVITIEKMAKAHDLPLPKQATPGSSGFDLAACVEPGSVIELMPNSWLAVPTGIKLMMPLGTEAQIRPRSGLALNHGVTVLNAPGTVDSDYRGEIKVILINLNADVFRIERGARIAQMVFSTVPSTKVAEGTVDNSGRGSAGFGSTGT